MLRARCRLSLKLETTAQAALATLHQAITLGESAGLTRLLAGVYGRAAEIHRESGDLENAERFAELSSASTQASGDLWAVPQRLQTLAELQVARGRYEEADRVYDRAEAFLDSMIGNVSTVLEKTAVITASSQIYSQHFALIADHFNDPRKAYDIIEQVRGRAAADLLVAGSATPSEAKTAERAVSQLRLKLMAARSTDEVRSLRDQIFHEGTGALDNAGCKRAQDQATRDSRDGANSAGFGAVCRAPGIRNG